MNIITRSKLNPVRLTKVPNGCVFCIKPDMTDFLYIKIFSKKETIDISLDIEDSSFNNGEKKSSKHPRIPVVCLNDGELVYMSSISRVYPIKANILMEIEEENTENISLSSEEI